MQQQQSRQFFGRIMSEAREKDVFELGRLLIDGGGDFLLSVTVYIYPPA